jgi:excisionase family DNA binding protein
MSQKRTKTPEQRQAEYRWLTPSEAATRLGVSDELVRDLIREGHLAPPGVMDVSRSSRPRYRISPAAVDRYIAQSEERVAG